MCAGRRPACSVERWRGARLRFVGEISYALYLWHWPVIVELTGDRVGVSGVALTAVRVAVTLALAMASSYLVERPFRRARLAPWSTGWRVALAPVAMLATVGAVAIATVPAAATVAPGQTVHTGADVPGAGGLTEQRAIRLPAPATARSKLRVMLVGDSVMLVQGPAVQAALVSTGVVAVDDEGMDGWGLSRQVYPWRTQLPQAIAVHRPELIVAMWGWDNPCLVTVLPPPEPPPLCTPDDPAAYHRLLEQFVHVALARGNGVAGVLFEQYPPLGPLPPSIPNAAEQNRRRGPAERLWDAAVASLPAEFPGRVMYAPVGPAVERQPGSGFAAWLPPEGEPHAPPAQWVRCAPHRRHPFLPGPPACYAAASLADLTSLYRLPPPSAGWSTESWTRSADYDTPAGICPDDHPGIGRAPGDGAGAAERPMSSARAGAPTLSIAARRVAAGSGTVGS